MLAAFLFVQPWLVCLPVCLLEGHAAVPNAAVQQRMHAGTMPPSCHSGVTVRRQLPATPLLGAMLPSPRGPTLPRLAVQALRLPSAAALPATPVPSAESPPPRSV